MFIVDAHLDLAYNAVRGRELLKPADQQAADDQGIPTVGLPDLRRGGVGLVCATIFCEPALGGRSGYHDPEEASAAALQQLQWYQQQESAGTMRFVNWSQDLPDAPSPDGPQPAILLLEGAEALRSPSDVPDWFNAGLRIVGLAWKRTRFAGGTGEPGPLTVDGVEMVRALDQAGIIHDLSHLAEEAFWNLLDLSTGPMMASHSNCRAIVPTDRQLSDDMIRAIVGRGGIVGINFFDKFLLSPQEYGQRRAALADVVRHVLRICDHAGDARHVGLGTDMDGGLGREQIPQEIQSSTDLPKIANALADARFTDEQIAGILGRNWLRFFRRHI